MPTPATITATGQVLGVGSVYYKLVAQPAGDGFVFDGSIQKAVPDGDRNISLTLLANAQWEIWTERGEHRFLFTTDVDCLLPSLLSDEAANP